MGKLNYINMKEMAPIVDIGTLNNLEKLFY